MSIEFEMNAWITEYSSLSPADIQTVEGAARLSFLNIVTAPAGWTLAGTAKITFEPASERALIDSKVVALKEQAKQIRADATAACTRIEGQIQQLIAIENSVPA